MIVKLFPCAVMLLAASAGLASGQSPASAGINYTTAQWVPMMLAQQQPRDGTQVWCLMANAFGTTPANSVVPTMLDEIRKRRGGEYEAMIEVQPGGPTTTPGSPAEAINPVSGTVFPRTPATLPYPWWTRNAPACGNNPSLTFSAKSLQNGEARASVKILIAF